MIETSIPGLNVAELMQRVQAEAAKIAERDRGSDRGTERMATRLPTVRVLPSPPSPVRVRPVNLKRERVDDLLRRAREATQVASWIPKFLRGLFRRQGAFNHDLLEAVTSLVKTNSEMVNRIRDLGHAVETQSRWLHVLAERRAAENTWMRAVERRLGDASETGSSDTLRAMQGELDRLRTEVINLQHELSTGKTSGDDQFRPMPQEADQNRVEVSGLQLQARKDATEARNA